MDLDNIPQHVLQLVKSFYENHIVNEKEVMFWDLVVISAADKEQKLGFELQLESEIKRKVLPSKVQYLVIADLPSSILGSGGSTFHILNTLENQIKDFYTKKILLIHAGGFSKRLPNCSCLGKLFCSLPLEVETKTLSLLSLKLILVTPFLKFIKQGGLFICGSDDIEPYLANFENIENNDELDEADLVAIAHPSSIFIGSTHGVYILPPSQLRKEESCVVATCLEVLQKPSYDLMKERGAIVYDGQSKEFVYTDSMFWCNTKLVKKMVTFSRENRGVYAEETCIYGDFLACMGTRSLANKTYFRDKCKSDIKRKIAESFANTKANIMVLQQSRFFHLGTMPEYLDSLIPDGPLFNCLGMKVNVGSIVPNSLALHGVTMNSVLRAPVETTSTSILDTCAIYVPLRCEARSILSHCLINEEEIKIIPSGWLFHTAAIKEREEVLFVTIAFKVEDDLKEKIEVSQGWSQATDVPPLTSLWTSKLFRASQSMSESFLNTWKRVTYKPGSYNNSSETSYSMQDVIRLKYLPAMIKHRENIESEKNISL